MSTSSDNNEPNQRPTDSNGIDPTPSRPRLTGRRLAIGGAAAVAAVGLAVPAMAVVGDIDDDETDRPITGVALEKASAAALEHLGQGRVTDTEIEDEESYYEVEVTLEDGRQIDVQLDEDFNVVGSDADSEDDS